MEIIVAGKDLVKKYGELIAVDRISFQVGRGECLGFLGPNGAGKTTTMRMIYGFAPLTAGRLEVFGLSVPESIRQIKRRIGIVPQEYSLDPDLTVLQNLMIYARYFDIPSETARERAEELLGFTHLSEKKNEAIDRLSGGMKRRLLIARALINRPELMVLDEPTTGLDPQTRHLMWEKIRSLRSQGVTVVLTTHYMEEAAALCDRVLVIDQGRIVEEGAPTHLIGKHGVCNLEEVFLKLTGKELRD